LMNELMFTETDEPDSFSQAVNFSDEQHWKAVIKKEIDAD